MDNHALLLGIFILMVARSVWDLFWTAVLFILKTFVEK